MHSPSYFLIVLIGGFRGGPAHQVRPKLRRQMFIYREQLTATLYNSHNTDGFEVEKV
jgi:hypothetical protein